MSERLEEVKRLANEEDKIYESLKLVYKLIANEPKNIDELKKERKKLFIKLDKFRKSKE